MATTAAFAATLHTASTGGVDPSLKAANEIYERFMRCPIQKIAYEALVGDLLNCDFSWTTTIGSKTYSEMIKPDLYEHAMWTDFTRDMLLQISLYGFVLYRLVTVNISPEDDLEEKRIEERGPKRARTASSRLHKFPEVANGQNIALRWSKTSRRWVPHDDKGTKFKRSDGWRMIQPEPPVRVGPNDVPVYKSFAANAFHVSKLHSDTLANVGKRDDTNTDIGVYTQMIKSLTALGSGVSSQPWFQPGVHGAMSTAPGDMMQPFETRIADRLEAAVGLSRMSDQVRRLDEEPPINLTNKVTPPGPPPMKHTEHVITDGREAREVTYRRAPEDLVRLLDILFNLILFNWTVMPQVIGKNINSERIAASNRIAEVSIDRYNENIKQLRRFVQMAITEISREASGDVSTSVKMDPCITMHTLRMVEGILTTEASIKLHACVYELPVEYFDKARVSMKQDALVEKPEGDTRDRGEQTQDQKDAKMKAKNAPE